VFSCLALLALVPGQVAVVPAPGFSRETQTSAVYATVLVVNTAKEVRGSGVIVAREGKNLYVLTAQHVVKGARGLDVATFSAASYPRPESVYRSAEVVAAAADIRDLALIRVEANGKETGRLTVCPALALPDKARFPALAVGCGEGGEPTCVAVKVLGKKRIRRPGAAKSGLFWEVDRDLAEGRSGGALIDRHGHVLGIQSGTSNGKTYFCHAVAVREFLRPAGLNQGTTR
jgi:S1-C subfamily serine protease